MHGCRRIVLLAQLRCLAALVALSWGANSVVAEVPTPAEMEDVCRSWIAYRASGASGEAAWSGQSPRILRVDDLWSSSGDRELEMGAARANKTLLALAFQIEPDGYVVVPALRELPPIKVYSESGRFDPSATEGIPALVRDVLEARFALFEATFGSLDAVPDDDVTFDPRQRDVWTQLVEGYSTAGKLDGSPGSPGLLPRQADQGGPLLTSAWHQGAPYQDNCPVGDYGWLCPVGCVATAVSQIMNYHQWPPNGTGSHSYYWDGDESCSGNVPGQELFADFSDPYDWESMTDSCDEGCTEEEASALAELCYEFGVAVEMDYGVCGSDALSSQVKEALTTYFRYFENMEVLARSGYSMEDWFGLVKDEIEFGRPIYYDILSHAGVVDGWRDDGGILQYHFNYGWGGPSTAWYVIDGITGSSDPMFESMLIRILPDVENPFLVFPDGSGVYPTIQDAINAASLGDVIELADGRYRGEGNRDIDFAGKRVTLRSASGDPTSCIVDAEGTEGNPHVGFFFDSNEQPISILEGVTIENGFGVNRAGGIYVYNSSPVIRNCIIQNCTSDGSLYGGANAAHSTVVFEECVFRDNVGVGMFIRDSIPVFDGCTFADNSRTGLWIFDCYASSVRNCTSVRNQSHGLTIEYTPEATVENTILAFSENGRGFLSDDDVPTITCTDIYGNADGDWVGTIATQLNSGRNLSEDPLFCQISDLAIDLHLHAESPCAPEADPECGLMGAWPVACSSVDVTEGSPSSVGVVPTVWPNPMTSRCVIGLAGGSARGDARPSMVVMDVTGRIVTRLDLVRSGGKLGVVWDGRNEDGELVPSGVYFVRPANADSGVAARLVVAR